MATLLEESIDQRSHGTLAWLVSRQTFWVFVAAVINVTRNFAFVGIIALGMTAVIITGGIDCPQLGDGRVQQSHGL